MVQNLVTAGGVHLTDSVSMGTISDSDTSAPKASSKQDKPSNGSKMSDSEEQGTKTSERKSILVRYRVVQVSAISLSHWYHLVK